MSRVAISVDVDTTKTYHYTDPITFAVTVDCTAPVQDDILFRVVYIGDTYSDAYDQVLAEATVGPLAEGRQAFQLCTVPIDLTRIPIRRLFGLSSLMVVANCRDQEFFRLGYIVSVTYPGLSDEDLQDSEDRKPIDMGEEEEGEESVEVMADEELEEEDGAEEAGVAEEEEEEAEDGEEVDEEEGEGESDEEGVDASEEGESVADGSEEECSEATEEESSLSERSKQIQSALTSAFSHREPIPLETPIKADEEGFEYRGQKLEKAKIELLLMDKPIGHVREIEWGGDKENGLVESSSEDDGVKRVRE